MFQNVYYGRSSSKLNYPWIVPIMCLYEVEEVQACSKVNFVVLICKDQKEVSSIDSQLSQSCVHVIIPLLERKTSSSAVVVWTGLLTFRSGVF